MSPEAASLELAKLAPQHPAYTLWLENRSDGRPRYVAQRVPGSAVNPVAVVTADLAELRHALGAPGHNRPGARQR